MKLIMLQADGKMAPMTLAIMGTGTQAEYHLRSMFALEKCSEIRFKKVQLYGRKAAKLEKLASFAKEFLSHEARLGKELEIECLEMDSEDISQADVICTCTSSTQPILRLVLQKLIHLFFSIFYY